MHTYTNTINGQTLTSAQTFESKNPATGETLGLVPVCTTAQIDQAVTAAKNAQPAWAALPDTERKAKIMHIADVIQDHAEMLATWVTREQGKPLGGIGAQQVPGARFEVWGCQAWTQVPASLDLPVDLAFEDETRRDEVHRKPYGVVAAIAPWNWPLLIAIWQIIPALRTGNTVVIKPSEYTSIGTLELVRLIASELPTGVLNSISGGGEVGAHLVEHPDIDKIMFTGSAATGKRIAAAAAKNLTPTTLELGGNDAALVLPDADPQKIAMDLFWGAFINMGQTCACAKRLYVPEQLHNELVSELQQIAEAMPVGDGMQEGIAMGPIQNRMQYDKVSKLVAEAKADGATIISANNDSANSNSANNSSANSLFYPLTLVTNIQDGSSLVDQEQFGPVLPIIKYHDLDEAIANANRLDVGLGASVWGSDLEEARKVASRLQAGTVWINQHGAIHPMVPFGGTKKSGWGTEFGLEGLKAVTYPQVISIKKSTQK